ncbi:MAG: hypothetical protein KatS3mg077_1554 [Candidatus Binatia bacterium]|nr:MAG: hypothetical protein KatS3mg077_1554 [Candidatus Binatia bacterium]
MRFCQSMTRWIGLLGFCVRIAVCVGVVCGAPLVATARIVTHVTGGYSFWCPDDWDPKCLEPTESYSVAACNCSRVRHDERERRFKGPRGPVPGLHEIIVSVAPLTPEKPSCAEWVGERIAMMGKRSLSEIRRIGDRGVLYVRTYDEWDYPPAVSEEVCFEERGKLVSIGWGVTSEPSPGLREYQAIWEQAVKSFRWVEGTPSAGPGRSTVSSAAD